MANYKKKIKKKDAKKVEVKEESNDIKSFVKIVAIIAVAIGVVYLFTYFMNEKGVFTQSYERAEVADAVIDYEQILLGSTFNRSEKTYYVVFDTFSDNADIYLNNIIYAYDGDISLYQVDMSLSYNKAYVGEKSNKKATKAEDLVINGPTLIKIVNGKIASYIEGTENIAGVLE